MKNLFALLFLFLAFLSLTVQAQTQPPAKSKRIRVQPALIRGPYLQMAGPTNMTIRWRTNTNDRSRVKYGLSPDALNLQVDDSTLVIDHEVQLKNLKPNTRYYYSIHTFTGKLQGDSNNYFYTLPEAGSRDTLRIAAFGDCGNNSPNQISVRDAFISHLGNRRLNSWILLGDNAYYYGTDAEYQYKFFEIYQDNLLKKYPLFPSPGNHDYGDQVSAGKKDQHKIAYFQNFSVPTGGECGGYPSNSEAYYAFDIGNVHFISLDSYGKDEQGKLIFAEDGAQMEWLKKDLEANKNKEWKIAYWHHPPYTMGTHNSDKESILVNIRQNVNKILEDYGVDLVLCGHSHVYERSRLMKGYFGMEADFKASKYNLNSSSGLNDGTKNSAPYVKTSDKGTVYVVSGSAGALGGTVSATYPHDAMFYSNKDIGGSFLLEVTGNKLNAKWICSDGKVRDDFTIMKNTSAKMSRK